MRRGHYAAGIATVRLRAISRTFRSAIHLSQVIRHFPRLNSLDSLSREPLILALDKWFRDS
jgi:hypothetical protein